MGNGSFDQDRVVVEQIPELVLYDVVTSFIEFSANDPEFYTFFEEGWTLGGILAPVSLDIQQQTDSSVSYLRHYFVSLAIKCGAFYSFLSVSVEKLT